VVRRVIRVGTRSSALAQAQTDLIVAALMQVDPDLQVDRVIISTNGDRTQPSNAPGPDWGTGVFVKEIEAALLREEIDLAVHSRKDVPPIVTAELALAAIPVRDDPHDVLVTQRGLSIEDLEPGARVGTSSARRVAFLQQARRDLTWEPVRGNVESRLRKLREGQYDALVLARAGLRRLAIEVPRVVLEPDLLPPAPGQGALAVQARSSDQDILSLVEPLDDPATAAAVRAERHLMLLLDGGCRLPVGALGTSRADGGLDLLGGLATDDGGVAIARGHGLLAMPEVLADQLASLLRAGFTGVQPTVQAAFEVAI
jgi:hydroxymethylbilane synthase